MIKKISDFFKRLLQSVVRLKLLILAVVLSAVAIGMWQWQGAQAEIAQGRHDGWMAYVQGPLSDLLYGSSRLRPLLAKKKLNLAEKAEAKEAVEHLRRSSSRSQLSASLFQHDKRMQPLAEATLWHQEIYNLMSPWPNLLGRPLAKEALVVEADMRLRLWTLLKAQRETLIADKLLSKDEVLETNALLYSLQEEAKADNRPLGKI